MSKDVPIENSYQVNKYALGALIASTAVAAAFAIATDAFGRFGCTQGASATLVEQGQAMLCSPKPRILDHHIP